MPALSRLTLSREPAIYVQLVAKLIDALVLFGLDISDGQALAVIAVVEVVAAIVTRGQVTPVADPAPAVASSAAARAVADELRSTIPVEETSEHAKLAALGAPPPPGPAITDGTLEGYPPAKAPPRTRA